MEVTAFGPPRVLAKVGRPDPVPAAGEVLVDVAHTGLDGGYATQVRVRVDRVVAVPDDVALTDAPGLVHDLPRALSLFDRLAVAGAAVEARTALGATLLLP